MDPHPIQAKTFENTTNPHIVIVAIDYDFSFKVTIMNEEDPIPEVPKYIGSPDIPGFVDIASAIEAGVNILAAQQGEDASDFLYTHGFFIARALGQESKEVSEAYTVGRLYKGLYELYIPRYSTDIDCFIAEALSAIDDALTLGVELALNLPIAAGKLANGFPAIHYMLRTIDPDEYAEYLSDKFHLLYTLGAPEDETPLMLEFLVADERGVFRDSRGELVL